ncbi:MAG: hypothetical protein QOE92_2094 [Chloroflexota bacterium]|nr:hypothetical protein [Chloroflexota bacterium]
MLEPGVADAEPGEQAETREKLGRLREAMAAADLDAVYLEGWANVAWLSGGRGNRVVLDSPLGLCAMLVGANQAWVLAPNNEEARVRSEAFAGLPLPVLVRSWDSLPLWRTAAAQLPPGARWAADVGAEGAADAGPLLASLRQVLGAADAARYRALGADAARALETALLEVAPDWTELDVAGAVAAALKTLDIEATVILVGGRGRAERFRHLVPTAALVTGGLVASVTAVRHGLHVSTTRCLSFGPVPTDTAEKHAVVVAVERAYLRATRPGMTLGQAFAAGEQAYAAGGFYDDWKEHHQGGTTGYAGREVFATQGADHVLQAGMAVAWNPTVPGAKSEDTFLVADGGLEWLSRAPGSRWPVDGDPLPRLGILEL